MSENEMEREDTAGGPRTQGPQSEPTGAGSNETRRVERNSLAGDTPADPQPTAGEHVDADRPAGVGSGASPVAGADSSADLLRERVVGVLKSCYDPEIPVDIYELGLIYSIDVEEPGRVRIAMTLTSPMCPVAGTLPPEVEAKVRELPEATEVQVDVVWEPPWNPGMMSEAARLQLNMV